MYDYRRLTPEQRAEILRERRARGLPLHEPPHFYGEAGEFLITAACYEHQRIFEGPENLSMLAETVLRNLDEAGLTCYAWVFLPNHYHLVVAADDLRRVSKVLQRTHGFLAAWINQRQRMRGRRVWYRFTDRKIRNLRHHWATVRYLHWNPVKHGYVDHPMAWPWSSYMLYVDRFGLEAWQTLEIQYPIDRYGHGWDE
ncbi:MAG TPA: hypothetical protein VNK89_11380 [Thermoflexus sp.]|nr:hypothetical protein [Thermoflexus sp.]